MDHRRNRRAVPLSILPQGLRQPAGHPYRNQVVVPLLRNHQGLSLIVARGPSLDSERIHAWLHVGDIQNAPGPVMGTFDAPLSECSIIRDSIPGFPLLKIGQAKFRINEHSASQLRTRFKFTDLAAEQ